MTHRVTPLKHKAAALSAWGCRLTPPGKPRRVIDEGRTATGSAPPPARPQLVLRARTSTSLHLEWEEPDDHGDEIYLYVLQMAEHEVTWQERTADFFDGYRPATPRDGRLQPRASPCNPMAHRYCTRHTAHCTRHTGHGAGRGGWCMRVPPPCARAVSGGSSQPTRTCSGWSPPTAAATPSKARRASSPRGSSRARAATRLCRAAGWPTTWPTSSRSTSRSPTAPPLNSSPRHARAHICASALMCV